MQRYSDRNFMEEKDIAYNAYINALISLRKDLDNRIDNEIDECMRGRGDSANLKESLRYIIDVSKVLNGAYKEYETGK